MRIAQLAPPFERVPPTGYGGTERVVYSLTEELVQRGHEVTLFASGDSQTSARLIPTIEQAAWHREPPFRDLAPLWSRVIGRAQRELESFDVVHSHLDVFGLPLTRQSSVPVVTTMHGRVDLPEVELVTREFSEAPLVSISNAQAGLAPYANFVATVYHGIELERFTFNPKPDDYLAFLGRVSREKGLHTAIRLARRVGRKLKVAARLTPPSWHLPSAQEDWDYWENEVKPMLGEDVELLGEISGAEKIQFLCNATALLFPIDWPEPFGLVMIEALACGTPVVALRRGSVPEIVRHGETGMVADNEEELAHMLGSIDDLDRGRCRAEAEGRFTPAAMASGYERVYESLSQSSAAARQLRDMSGIEEALFAARAAS